MINQLILIIISFIFYFIFYKFKILYKIKLLVRLYTNLIEIFFNSKVADIDKEYTIKNISYESLLICLRLFLFFLFVVSVIFFLYFFFNDFYNFMISWYGIVEFSLIQILIYYFIYKK